MPQHLVCSSPARSYVVPMDWQEMAALAIVAGVCVAWVLRLVNRPKMAPGARSACRGCAAAMTPVAPPTLLIRARKGEQPVILVTMK